MLDIYGNTLYNISMMTRKKRSDRNHVLYRLACDATGDFYVGVTAVQGQAPVRSVKVRVQKHMSRAKKEKKSWTLYVALRKFMEAKWTYEVLEVVRGRKNAHQRERQLIAKLKPTLNTF